MSIVSAIPAGRIDKRQHVTLNALEFAFAQVAHRYSALRSECLSCHAGESSQSSLAVSLAWDVIDWCEKLRKLLGSGSGVRKRDVWFRILEQKLACAKDARDFIQHFDRSINALVDACEPPLGFVSALFPKDTEEQFDVRILHSGSFFVEKGNPFKVAAFKMPSTIRAPIDHITLFIGKRNIDLSHLAEAVAVAHAEFVKFIKETYVEAT